ncbi:alpha/beta hydrolase [Streptomyces sp. NPDC014646]|uniref:alpha/beta hydrolase n=1 Tax=Streptomyces sp. NPDC014646 TaxID=3364877 RepID=UPI0036FDB86A
MDYRTLRALEPSRFTDAADGYRAVRDMASAAKDHLDKQVAAGMRKTLDGEAAQAALKQLQGLSANFHYAQVECGLVSTALNGFGHDIEVAKRRLDSAVEDAHADRMTVNSDGSVSYPAGGERAEGELSPGGKAGGVTDEAAQAVNRQAARFDPNPYYARAQAYADRIAAALKEATEADEKWAPKLRALKADDDLTVSDRDWTDVKSDTGGVLHAADHYLGTITGPPEEGDAEDNAAWWKGLTPEQRADYLAVHPAAVGALDGLPAEVRDEANRLVLAESRAAYQLELKSIPPEPIKYAPNSNGSYPIGMQTEAWREWNEKYGGRKAFLEQGMKGMVAIQDRFDRTGEDGLPEAYLLGFDLEGKGDGRVILANGNPDDADHTAVYVPGTFAGIESIGEGRGHGDLGRGERLWVESSRLVPGEKVATITWLDYNAPDSIVPEATRGRYAEEGGPILRQFLDGNRVAHQQETGGSTHTTVIGHSYGSTVVGVAAQSGSWRDGPLADDILVAGSPGVQADKAADLGVGADHVWAMGGPWDDQFVRQGGRMMGLGDNWTIPTDESFGGKIMKNDSDGHGGFWDSDGQNASLALKNQARVITGRYGDVVLDD